MARGRPTTAFPRVQTAAVGDVVVGTHSLTKQAERLTSLTNRVLRRLHHEMRTNPAGLPSPAWLEAFRYVAPTILALLREQRERASLNRENAGAAPLSDAELEAGMRDLAAQAVLELPQGELEALLRRRGSTS